MRRLLRRLHRPDNLGARAADLLTRASGSWPALLGFLGLSVAYPPVAHLIRFDEQLTYFTFAVSVAAIALSQIILMSQVRAAQRAEQRDIREAEQVDALWQMRLEHLEISREVRDLTKAIHEHLNVQS